MSNKYKHGEKVPSNILIERLNELSDAVIKGRDAIAREFTMSIPAELDRDADLVLSASASMLQELAKQNEALMAQVAELQRKASLWDTLTSLGRIRTLGWAKLGEEGYQHIGYEFWTMYGTTEDNYDFTETNADAIKKLEIFLNAWAASPQSNLTSKATK